MFSMLIFFCFHNASVRALFSHTSFPGAPLPVKIAEPRHVGQFFKLSESWAISDNLKNCLTWARESGAGGFILSADGNSPFEGAGGGCVFSYPPMRPPLILLS
ncbi:Uncharacterized protein dnm_007670 [Desulfonema magnum]|uniref:Uncharacterized protein n=1 Tax=Desulfonema magnum TaxID=45655 RepID=A0A975BG34_9BACT|nr:Uncharacterized protein dnm_007670 [Desulfonema magnum]